MKKVFLAAIVLFFAVSVSAQRATVKIIKDSTTVTIYDKRTNVTYTNAEACLNKYSLSTGDSTGKYVVSYLVEFYFSASSRLAGYEPVLSKSYKVLFNSYPTEAQILTSFVEISF